MMSLYQTKTIRQIENTIFAEEIATESELMRRAGHAAFSKMRQKWPAAQRILVICGKGNNAGDGFVLAKEAYLCGLSVSVLILVEENDYRGAAKEALSACLSAGVSVASFDESVELVGDVIVDAIFGVGLSRDVSGVYQKAIEAINAVSMPVLSLDVPSGLAADTGSAFGCVVQAAMTVTFIALKTGLYTGKGAEYAGEIVHEDLAVPQRLFELFSPSAYLMASKSFTKPLPSRHRDAHKGDFGHVLIIGGDYGMGGAVCMAAEAALRVGAGLVSVATRPEHVGVVSGSRPEIMCHQIEKIDALKPLIAAASVIVIGPGLGRGEWSAALLEAVLQSNKPKVLDADSLNLLANIPKHSDEWILTPHPGEAGRLLHITTEAVQKDRFVAAESLVKKFGGVCVLKGAGTIVQSENMLPCVCAAGNPGMATAGMGDVLSGVIGGLLAQGLALVDAAKQGVMLHALAADAAAELGGERGLLATDLMLHLRRLVNE